MCESRMGASWCTQVQPGHEMQSRSVHLPQQRAPQHMGEQYQSLAHPPPPAHQAAPPPQQAVSHTRWRCEENDHMRAMAEEMALQATENIRAGIKKESAIAAACTVFETVFLAYMEKTNPAYPYPEGIRDQFAIMGKELIAAVVEKAVRQMEEQHRVQELQQQQSVQTMHQHQQIAAFASARPAPVVQPSEHRPFPTPPPPAKTHTSDSPAPAPGGSVRGGAPYSTQQLPQSPVVPAFSSTPPRINAWDT